MFLDNMMEIVAANGVFAVLFFFLLILEIRDSRRREEKYHNIVDKLTDELYIVKDVNDNVDEVLHRVISIERERVDEEVK